MSKRRRSLEPSAPSRRAFLGVSAGTLALLSIPGCRLGTGRRDLSALVADATFPIVRAADLLAIELAVVGFARAADRTRLIASGPPPRLVVLTFPPQHVLEECDPGELPARARCSADTAIAFHVPDDVAELPLDTAALFELLRRCPLAIVAGGVEPDDPVLGPGDALVSSSPVWTPGSLETRLELPGRLALSPNQHARFVHATAPVDIRGRAEVWHTRLAIHTPDGDSDRLRPDRRTVRALVARTPNEPSPPRYPLEPGDRAAIVGAATPVRADLVAVSSLGAWADLGLESDGPVISRWTNRSRAGRDEHVELVVPGFLLPARHPAPLVVVTRRQFGLATPIAALHREAYLELPEPVADYQPLDGPVAGLARRLPLASIRLLVDRTPPLDNVPSPDPSGRRDPFTPEANGSLYRFPVIMTDRDGNEVRTELPLRWIPAWLVDDPIGAIGDYRALGDQRRAALGGQRLAVAPRSATSAPSFESHGLWLGAEYVAALPRPRFYPIVDELELVVEAVRQVTGRAAPERMTFAAAYADHGFDAAPGRNPRELILALSSGATQAIEFAGHADTSGGFVSPDLGFAGLSRLAGPIGELAADPLGTVVKAFAGGAKLFGCVPFADILLDQIPFEDMTPRLVTDALHEAEHYLQTLHRLWAQAQAIVAQLERARDDIQHVPGELRAVAASLRDALDRVYTDLASLDLSTTPPDDLARALRDWLANPAPPSLRDDLIALRDRIRDPLAGRLGLATPGLDGAIRQVRGWIDAIVDGLDVVVGALDAFIAGQRAVKDQRVHLEWRPPLKDVWLNGQDRLIQFDPPVSGTPTLLLSADLRGTSSGGARAGVDVLASLEGFHVFLPPGTPVLALDFGKLQFRKQTGKKAQIDVVFKGLTFQGPLGFVETLRHLIPLDGFSDPPFVDVTPTGLVAGFTMALPNLAIGVFSLENLALGARLAVPFVGDAMSFTFEFCKRDSPFRLTVSALGGGGYFGMTLTPKGLTALEAKLEFGASLSINLGVASGSVSAMGGVYFGMTGTGPAAIVELTGYFRLRGEVDVLGLISASIELRLELEYHEQAGCHRMTGRATLEIEVSVAFFHKKVKLEAERRFAGANGDPTFEQVMGTNYRGPWTSYCEAFAAVA